MLYGVLLYQGSTVYPFYKLLDGFPAVTAVDFKVPLYQGRSEAIATKAGQVRGPLRGQARGPPQKRGVGPPQRPGAPFPLRGQAWVPQKPGPDPVTVACSKMLLRSLC